MLPLLTSNSSFANTQNVGCQVDNIFKKQASASREGASVKTFPGEPVRMEKDGIMIEPFGLFRQFAEGKLTAEQWRQQCEMLRIGSVDLGTTGTPA